jgi:hypothetical protein
MDDTVCTHHGQHNIEFLFEVILYTLGPLSYYIQWLHGNLYEIANLGHPRVILGTGTAAHNLLPHELFTVKQFVSSTGALYAF